MRMLMWFAIGFAAACGMGVYGELPGLLPGITLALGLLILLLSGRRPHFRIAALLILGISCGSFRFIRFEARTLQSIYALDGIVMETTVRCVALPEHTDYGIRAEGRINVDGKAYAVMCYLDEETDPMPGSILSGPFRFRVTAPGGGKESSYYQGEGIFLLAYQTDRLQVTAGEITWREYAAVLRGKIAGILGRCLPEDTEPFAKALLLGDSSDLSYEVLTDFSVSGIRHTVAVSGLHVSILFSLVGMILFGRRILTALVGFPVLLLFAAMTGFTPSVSRACIMSGLMLLGTLLNREYDCPASLSFAGLVLLIRNPLAITSVSYQLSFASVAGIFLFSPGIRKWLLGIFAERTAGGIFGKIANWAVMSVSVTLGATVATVPLCALYFGTVSLAAVLTNLLVLWAVSLIFYGLVLMCVLGGIWPGVGMALGSLVSWLIRYVLLTAKVIADFPLAAVYSRSPYMVFWLIFVYLLLGLFLLSRNRQPVTLCCCAVLGLCLSLLAAWTEPGRDDVRFSVLDVGQGQCLLFQTEGRNFLVDCGGSTDAMAANAAAETLLSQGISRLDGVILTHYDKDHAGGLPGLLSRISAEVLIVPPVRSEMLSEEEQVLYAEKDLVLTVGESKIRIFASDIPGNGNENSLCILFDTNNCDILVTGDRNSFGERSLLRHAAIPDVDVLVAGHHGSKNAVCEELLRAVQPEIVCVSAGKGNAFGHPAPELLERLEHFGCTVYRTDLHGDILIRR